MNDVMVSIRIPAILLNELRDSVDKGHYMDISEAIRAIARDKWMQYKQPELMELKELRRGIEKELKKKTEKTVMKEVIAELKKIKEQIKDEGLSR